MSNILVEIRTNLSNTFYDIEEDEENFYDWMCSDIHKDMFSMHFAIEPEGFEGITKLEAFVDEFTEDHDIDVYIEINGGSVDAGDESIVNNDALFDYIENEFMPKFIEQFNSTIKVIYPISNEDDFSTLRFGDDNFFTKVYFSENGNNFGTVPIKAGTLALTDDFEIFV